MKLLAPVIIKMQQVSASPGNILVKRFNYTKSMANMKG